MRYLLPLLLALQLVVAWGFARVLTGTRPILRGASIGLLLLLLGAGFASQLRIIAADSWWSKSFSAENADVARLINGTERPLLVGSFHDVGAGEMLSLAYLLQPGVRVLLEDTDMPLKLPNDFTDLFAFLPSDRVRERFASSYRFEPVPGSWKWYHAVPLQQMESPARAQAH